jgi:hypothetical protein
MSDKKDVKNDPDSKGLVDVDITQIIAFESHLRDSLAVGTAILLTENNVKVKASSPSNTKAATLKVAKISDKLRSHLVEAGVISKEDNEKLRERTGIKKLVDSCD